MPIKVDAYIKNLICIKYSVNEEEYIFSDEMHFTQYQICYKHDYKMNTINKIPCIPLVIIQLYSLIVLQVHVYFSSDVIFVNILLSFNFLYATERDLIYLFMKTIIKDNYIWEIRISYSILAILATIIT